MVDYLSRRDALRKILIDKAESAVFFDAVSIRYLSGFSGSNAALLIGQDQEIDVLLTDSRYTQRAKDESPDIEVQIDREFNKQIHKHLDSKSIKKIAIDSTRMNIAQGEALSNKNTFELVKIKELLAPLRSVKDDYEIKQIKKACAITADTLWFLINDLRPGMNERQISNLLQEGFLKRGADGLAFASIVASGENSATPHHEPTKRILERGDMVTIDCGALVNGYHADMTRTVFIGTCADWQKDIYDLVMKAQEAGRKKLTAGAIAEEVDEATRKIIRDANYGEFFVHGTGHGVGLEIHEPVFIAKDVKTKLSSGSCITVEPGIYLPGKGGVRIEDTCLVTEADAEVLTPGSHEIICVA
jgi:Xaa-Pro aminopeptidase